MNTTTWHVYRKSDGVFVGRSFSTLAVDNRADQSTFWAAVAANVPEGHGVVANVADWQSQRVDPQTGAVVDWRPPAPPDDGQQTWAWHEDAGRWISTPTPAAQRAKRREAVQAVIATLEASQARPAREIALATCRGLPVPPGAADRMAQIDMEISRLRAGM